jgi:hypothetical protein
MQAYCSEHCERARCLPLAGSFPLRLSLNTDCSESIEGCETGSHPRTAIQRYQSKTATKNGEWKLTNPSQPMARSLHEGKCPYKENATPSKRRQESRVTYWQETYLAQTHFRKTEKRLEITLTKCIGYLDASQNSPQATNSSYIKQISPNLDLQNATQWYSFHFERRHSRTFPIESLDNDSGHTLVRVEYGYPKGSPDSKT